MPMGLADDDADSLELGSMPPLPHPKPRPSARSPLSVVTGNTCQTTSTPRHAHFKQEEMGDVEVSPAPTPHAHPLRGWEPHRGHDLRQNTAVASKAGIGAGGAALMEHLRRPVQSRHVEAQRLDTTFLNHDRIAALANKENEAQERTMAPAIDVTPHSTRILQSRIHQVEVSKVEKRPLGDEELRYAATEASLLRQRGYDDIDSSALIVPSHQPDSALERARVRKVKKQVDAKWLEKRNDQSLRPRGPLEREDELAFYDSMYQVCTQELLDEGVLFNDQDRKNALSVTLDNWTDLARDKRGTTGVLGSCFDRWSFN